MGGWGDGEMGGWGDEEMGGWGDEEMGGWGDEEVAEAGRFSDSVIGTPWLERVEGMPLGPLLSHPSGSLWNLVLHPGLQK